MNLRVLKKLSKRAAPYLPRLGDLREQFRSERGENYHELNILDRSDFERSRCHPRYEAGTDEQIVYNTRAGHRIVMRPPSHPKKGTVMVGGMQGYYEPEWEEECAYAALLRLVFTHFTDWEGAARRDAIPELFRPLCTPTLVFAAADDMVRELAA